FIHSGSQARERKGPMSPAKLLVGEGPSSFRSRNAGKHTAGIVEREREEVMASYRDDRVALDLGPGKKTKAPGRKCDAAEIEGEGNASGEQAFDCDADP